jgi:hypothetical protein
MKTVMGKWVDRNRIAAGRKTGLFLLPIVAEVEVESHQKHWAFWHDLRNLPARASIKEESRLPLFNLSLSRSADLHQIPQTSYALNG